jgi:hypothetical protein
MPGKADSDGDGPGDAGRGGDGGVPGLLARLADTEERLAGSLAAYAEVCRAVWGGDGAAWGHEATVRMAAQMRRLLCRVRESAGMASVLSDAGRMIRELAEAGLEPPAGP